MVIAQKMWRKLNLIGNNWLSQVISGKHGQFYARNRFNHYDKKVSCDQTILKHPAYITGSTIDDSRLEKTVLFKALMFISCLFQYLKKWFCVPNYEQHMQKVRIVNCNRSKSSIKNAASSSTKYLLFDRFMRRYPFPTISSTCMVPAWWPRLGSYVEQKM